MNYEQVKMQAMIIFDKSWPETFAFPSDELRDTITDLMALCGLQCALNAYKSITRDPSNSSEQHYKPGIVVPFFKVKL